MQFPIRSIYDAYLLVKESGIILHFPIISVFKDDSVIGLTYDRVAVKFKKGEYVIK